MITATSNEAGTKIYIIGNTFDVKGTIKAAGGQWDDVRRAWYLDPKRWELDSDRMREFLIQLNDLSDKIRAQGKKAIAIAIYQGVKFSVVWAGRTRAGYYMARIKQSGAAGDGFWVNYTTDLGTAARSPSLAYIDAASNKGIPIPSSEDTKRAPIVVNVQRIDVDVTELGGSPNRAGPPLLKTPKIVPNEPEVVPDIPPVEKSPPVKLKRKVKI